MQVPPVYSAVKIHGRRAYDYVRAGDTVKTIPRQVEIKKFEITNINIPKVDFRAIVSKGTYIRALVRDFGESLKCGAYLMSLCRTRIGNYLLEDAYTTEEFESYCNEKN
jgi:tRNA pseudouridine55 synthase